MNWRKKNKLRGSEVLKISNVKVQIHFLLKTMDTKKNLRDWDWVPFGFKKSQGFLENKILPHENNNIVGSQVRRENSPISVAKIYQHICGLQDCIIFVFANEKTIKTVKTSQSLCLENTLNSSNPNKFVSLKTTMLTTILHTYLSVQSLHTAVVSKYVFGSRSGSVVFKFLCSKNSPTEKNQLRTHFRIRHGMAGTTMKVKANI